MGFGRTQQDQLKEKTMRALQSFLRPEFINRVDEIITFNHLSQENFRDIADIMLQELRTSLEARGLTFTWDEDVRNELVSKAFSVTYGARNLRRTIQRSLEDPVSEAIIDSFENPISSIHAYLSNQEIRIETK